MGDGLKARRIRTGCDSPGFEVTRSPIRTSDTLAGWLALVVFFAVGQADVGG
jgi:hypothetical protein